MPAGKDSLGRIDEPEGAQNRRGDLITIWKETIEKVFEKKVDDDSKQFEALSKNLKLFSEPKVNSMLKEKKEEFEKLMKEI